MDTAPELLEYYRELITESSLLMEEICVTWCASDDLTQVGGRFKDNHLDISEKLSLLGAATEADQLYDQDLSYDDQRVSILIDLLRPRGVISVEPRFGWQGSREEVLASLSQLGRTLTFFRGVTGPPLEVTYAERGAVRERIQYLGFPYSSGPSEITPQLEQFPLSDEMSRLDWAATAFALGEWACGGRLDRDWLEATHPRIITTPASVKRSAESAIDS